ncbi:carcinoembryonic antigen-related cell adhesion molecule 1-like [Mya arenaria]|uniref:carcinoembryonic antigen-related cell adhesion molecule 1-like n=1 Tax=Mya arenaria TaxID=6604 RepID=UPI0022E51CBD|nr:carcinoembryonic antigen-related cell adhesion molecule 1-like [Mya arenaria]
MDKMVVRCTVQQDMRTPDGEGYIQTDSAISVMYKPVIRSIIGYPDKQLYIEGLEQLTLTCNAEGNPPPSYYWMFDNSTIAGCRSLVLDNLTAVQGGAYICIAYNSLKGVIQNVNASTYIVIQKTTSTSFDTTMSDSTTSHNEEEGTTSDTEPGFTTSTCFDTTMSDSTTLHNVEEGTTSDTQPGFSVGMIVGVIVGAFAVGAVGISLMLVRRCYRRRKVPEKPTYSNTELNTRSEDSTAIAEINKYDHVNSDRNEPQYQSLHQNPQFVNQNRATESDYTALDVGSHEDSITMTTDVLTDDRVQVELPTTSDSYTQDPVSEEALHHYQSLQRDSSSCETGYSELEVASA